MYSATPLNTPVAPTRRRFFSQAAGVAAGGTAPALATVQPALATATPASPLDPENASPALRAAVRALDDAYERLKQAKAVFAAAFAKGDEWLERNPRPIPSSRRALK
jgi:hypothetical protein